MTSTDIKRLRERWGLSVNDLACITGTASGRTVRRWENGSPIPASVIKLLSLLEQIEHTLGLQYLRSMIPYLKGF